MINKKAMFQAARWRTIPLSISSAIVAAGIANYLGAFDGIIFVMSLVTTILLQILSNYANDLGDSEKGTDNNLRIGPARAVQLGLISKDDMSKAVKWMMVLSLISGLILITISKLYLWQKILIFFIGLLAIMAANNYTRGKNAYGYKGFGDLVVFIFFGIIGVSGTLALYIHSYSNASILPAMGIGLLCVGVLHLNNMRDMENDQLSQKITLAIKLGKENARLYFLICILTAIILMASFVFTQNNVCIFNYTYWIGFIPLLWILVRFFKIKSLIDYDTLLKPLALTTFLIAILFFASQLI